MKKKWMFLLLLSGAVAFIVYLISPNSYNTTVISSSYNIVDSKRKEVFINEYQTSPKSFRMGGENYSISEVWVEKMWRRTSDGGINKSSSSVCYILFNDEAVVNQLSIEVKGCKAIGVRDYKFTFDKQSFDDSLGVTFFNQKGDSVLVTLSR